MKKRNTENNTTAIKLINQYGFSMRLIGRLTQVSEHAVRRCLDLNEFMALRPLYLSAIRRRIESLLAASDWNGDPATLWLEYDEYAQQQDKAA